MEGKKLIWKIFRKWSSLDLIMWYRGQKGRGERGVRMFLNIFGLEDWVNVSATHKGRDNRRYSLLWGTDGKSILTFCIQDVYGHPWSEMPRNQVNIQLDGPTAQGWQWKYRNGWDFQGTSENGKTVRVVSPGIPSLGDKIGQVDESVSKTLGLKFRTELGNGAWLERDNFSFKIERAVKRMFGWD